MPFVSFEGIDGSGKTTQLRLLADRLGREGHSVVSAKEPDGGRLGAEIRALMTARREFVLDPLEELLLVSASRLDHVRSVIRPALAAGAWVLCDRFMDSSFALQVHGTGIAAELWRGLADAVVGQTRPDLTFVLDLPPDLALGRRAARSGAALPDPAEANRDFARIREGFRTAAAAEPGRCRLMDASGSEAALAEAIYVQLMKRGWVARPISSTGPGSGRDHGTDGTTIPATPAGREGRTARTAATPTATSVRPAGDGFTSSAAPR